MAGYSQGYPNKAHLNFKEMGIGYFLFFIFRFAEAFWVYFYFRRIKDENCNNDDLQHR